MLIGHYPPPVVLDPGQSLLEAMIALDQRGVRHGVVVDGKGRLTGILSIRRILGAVRRGYEEGSIHGFLGRVRVEDIMWRNPPHVVIGEFGVEDVIYIMSRLNIGAVVVVDKDEKVLGIISEKHIAGIMALTSIHAAVHEVMTKPARTVASKDPIISLLELMDTHRYRHAPIVSEQGTLEAMATARDLLGYLATEHTLSLLEKREDRKVMNTAVEEVAVGNPARILPEADIAQALRLMRKRGISGLAVVDSENKPVGIVSERDIVTKLPKLVGIEMFYDYVKSKLYIARIIS